VGTDIAGVLPVVGPFLLRFLRGGDEVTGATLTRLFGFHVAVLPAITTVFLGLHLYLVQKHGMSTPMSVDPDAVPKMKFVPQFVLRDLAGWLAAVALLAALAALFPWELGEKADPFAPAPAGIRPEWYFMFMFQTLKYIPARILGIDGEFLGILAFSLLGALLVLTPFVASGQKRAGRVDRVVLVGMIVVIYMLALTTLGYLS
jgi:cytochrome b6